jgi:hypothetical protein
MPKKCRSLEEKSQGAPLIRSWATAESGEIGRRTELTGWRAGRTAAIFRGGGYRGWLTQAPGDARFVQVVRRHFHFYAVACGQADKSFPHFAGDGGEDLVLIVQFDAKHCPGEDVYDPSLDLYVLFHSEPFMIVAPLPFHSPALFRLARPGAVG